ncbi:hypothetical protein LO772_26085 [Yinghuangia sp. ASG 101]|uniref:hypothetical protein n=1 Tax=Yinghuangia sp. ASG 101 TaxID=2896848 RepID=UPI001E2E99C3|nr:hypothetical protein [Yinghuangia sp. ASG 101]UGQ10311.1 hypothetical protein LO772_26085 [Yinghuangia sp. ASG 101]
MAPTSSAAIPGPPQAASGPPFQSYGGYPPAPPPGGPASGPGSGPGPARSRGTRNALIAGGVLLVVGGVIAALVFLLGGDDGDPDPEASGPTATAPTGTGPTTATSSPSPGTPTPPQGTDGTVTDPRSGITLPVMRDWIVPAGEPEIHQVSHETPCTGSETASPGTADPCYLGEINLGVFEGESFDALVSELQHDVVDNANFRTTSTVKDQPTSVDGKGAHLLVIEVEEKAADTAGTPRAATFQYVVIDVPLTENGKRSYPVVFVGLDNDPAAPPDSVFDTVLDGIKVGTPAPASS